MPSENEDRGSRPPGEGPSVGDPAGECSTLLDPDAGCDLCAPRAPRDVSGLIPDGKWKRLGIPCDGRRSIAGGTTLAVPLAKLPPCIVEVLGGRSGLDALLPARLPGCELRPLRKPRRDAGRLGVRDSGGVACGDDWPEAELELFAAASPPRERRILNQPN